MRSAPNARTRVRPTASGRRTANGPIASVVRHLACCGGLLLALLSAPPASAESFLEVTESDDGFTIEAEEVSVARILKAIAAKANFEVVDATGVAETLAIFSVENQPLPEALQSLLAKQNHLIVYAGSENPEAQGKIAKIILMRPASETRPGATRGRGASPLAGPDAKPASRETRDAPAARGASSPTETLTGDPGELANPQDFADPDEEFDTLLDSLDPADADEIRQALQAEFRANEE